MAVQARRRRGPIGSASASRTASTCSGSVTSSSSDSGSVGSFRAARSVCFSALPGAGEHDLGALLLGELGHPEARARRR